MYCERFGSEAVWWFWESSATSLCPTLCWEVRRISRRRPVSRATFIVRVNLWNWSWQISYASYKLNWN